MTPARTERVPKEQSRAYLTKAEEFRWAMENALVAGKLNAAVSGAVHCVTSACDALLAHHLGVRCKGQDHREIVSLLPGLPFRVGPERPRQILSVLDLKAVAEYRGSKRHVARGEKLRPAGPPDSRMGSPEPATLNP